MKFTFILSCLICFSTIAFSQSEGLATVYDDNFEGMLLNDKKARYNPNLLTAAHKKYKNGTKVKVTRSDNGKSVVVTINDKGPYKRGCIIKLSREAAKKLDMRIDDEDYVTIQVINEPKPTYVSKKTTTSSTKGSGKIDLNSSKVSPYGIFKVSTERLTVRGYGVQVALFANYSNLLKQIAILEQNGIKDVVIKTERKNNKD